STPGDVVMPPAWSAVSMGGSTLAQHTIAITTDGQVLAWGRNDSGQIGDGSTTSRLAPVAVFSLYARPADLDGDGLDDLLETILGTDPTNADTNGDGIPDANALAAGLSATNPDMDSDGVSNVVERQQGTDPFRADTDGDGVPDGTDVFPLDPTRSTLGPGDPSDVEPPLITLIEPPNAVLVSSVPPQP